MEKKKKFQETTGVLKMHKHLEPTDMRYMNIKYLSIRPRDQWQHCAKQKILLDQYMNGLCTKYFLSNLPIPQFF